MDDIGRTLKASFSVLAVIGSSHYKMKISSSFTGQKYGSKASHNQQLLASVYILMISATSNTLTFLDRANPIWYNEKLTCLRPCNNFKIPLSSICLKENYKAFLFNEGYKIGQIEYIYRYFRSKKSCISRHV